MCITRFIKVDDGHQLLADAERDYRSWRRGGVDVDVVAACVVGHVGSHVVCSLAKFRRKTHFSADILFAFPR